MYTPTNWNHRIARTMSAAIVISTRLDRFDMLGMAIGGRMATTGLLAFRKPGCLVRLQRFVLVRQFCSSLCQVFQPTSGRGDTAGSTVGGGCWFPSKALCLRV